MSVTGWRQGCQHACIKTQLGLNGIFFHAELKNMYFSHREDIHMVRSLLSPFCTHSSYSPFSPPTSARCLPHPYGAFSMQIQIYVLILSLTQKLEYFLSAILSLFHWTIYFGHLSSLLQRDCFHSTKNVSWEQLLCPGKSSSLLGSCTELGVDPSSSVY